MALLNAGLARVWRNVIALVDLHTGIIFFKV